MSVCNNRTVCINITLLNERFQQESEQVVEPEYLYPVVLIFFASIKTEILFSKPVMGISRLKIQVQQFVIHLVLERVSYCDQIGNVFGQKKLCSLVIYGEGHSLRTQSLVISQPFWV